MSELFLRRRLSRYKAICISELSDETLANQPGYCETVFGSALFLYLVDSRPKTGGITVLASVPSIDAAYHFFDSVVAEFES